MARINQDLIERIANKLAIGSRSLYRYIEKITNETMLDPDLAALVLAARHVDQYQPLRDAAATPGDSRGSHNGG